MLLPLTDQQLAVIEHRRAGADLQIQLNVDVALGYHPLAKGRAGRDIWPVRAFQETIFVQRESWTRLLTQAPAGTSLAVVVPVPLDGSAATNVGTLLREAIDKVNKGEYGDAVTAARRAIDAMGAGWPPRRTSPASTRRSAPWISAFPLSGMPCTAWRAHPRTATLWRTRSSGTGQGPWP